MFDALQRIQSLAKTLGEAPLKVLIDLACRAPDPPFFTVCSSRQLAEATGLARKNVQAALDLLTKRELIQTIPGSAVKPSGYRLVFLEVTVLLGGGYVKYPPVPQEVASSRSHPGLFSTPPPATLSSQGGYFSTPPPDQNSTTYEPGIKERARVEKLDRSNEQVFDRVLTANPKKIDDAERAWGREWLYGYMRKFGPEREPHPPDDLILAQFLAIAPQPRLEGILKSLFKARVTAGRTYAWFIAVALDRIHGLKFDALVERRAELELVKKPAPAPAVQQPLLTPEEPVVDLQQALRDGSERMSMSKAAGKGMR